jgi:hypothetical protein
MSRNGGKFYRSDEISVDRADCPTWLDAFALKQASKSAVEVARERNRTPSVSDQMSSLISGGPPKFSSVEDVVKDYQSRTGLSSHLQRTSGLGQAAKMIVSAAEEEDDLIEGLEDIEVGEPENDYRDIMDELLEIEDPAKPLWYPDDDPEPPGMGPGEVPFDEAASDDESLQAAYASVIYGSKKKV